VQLSWIFSVSDLFFLLGGEKEKKKRRKEGKGNDRVMTSRTLLFLTSGKKEKGSTPRSRVTRRA